MANCQSAKCQCEMANAINTHRTSTYCVPLSASPRLCNAEVSTSNKVREAPGSGSTGWSGCVCVCKPTVAKTMTTLRSLANVSAGSNTKCCNTKCQCTNTMHKCQMSNAAKPNVAMPNAAIPNAQMTKMPNANSTSLPTSNPNLVSSPRSRSAGSRIA